MTDAQPPGDFRPDGPDAAPAKPKASKKAKTPAKKKSASKKAKAPSRKQVRTARLDLRCTPAERALAIGVAKKKGCTVTDLVMGVLKRFK